MGDRHGLTVRLNDTQYELLRRRTLSEGVSFQQVLAAGANAYILGDLRILPNGRYHVAGPSTPNAREDEVTVRAPTTDQPERTVTLRQPPAHDGPLGTKWLVDHIWQTTGKKVGARMMRRLLSHLEEEGLVHREGRNWRFDGPDDARVAAVRIAIDDGTWDLVLSKSMDGL